MQIASTTIYLDREAGDTVDVRVTAPEYAGILGPIRVSLRNKYGVADAIIYMDVRTLERLVLEAHATLVERDQISAAPTGA